MVCLLHLAYLMWTFCLKVNPRNGNFLHNSFQYLYVKVCYFNTKFSPIQLDSVQSNCNPELQTIMKFKIASFLATLHGHTQTSSTSRWIIIEFIENSHYIYQLAVEICHIMHEKKVKLGPEANWQKHYTGVWSNNHDAEKKQNGFLKMHG